MATSYSKTDKNINNRNNEHMRWVWHLNLVIDSLNITAHLFCDYNWAIILIFAVLEPWLCHSYTSL